MRLSPRETQILRLICQGRSRKQIASELETSEYTVDTLIRRIRDKTGCHKVALLVMWAVVHEIVQPKRKTTCGLEPTVTTS
jgi:DNA-binding CsgD family transcriptional regulator